MLGEFVEFVQWLLTAFSALVITLIGAAYLGFALVSFNHDKLLHFGVFFTLTVEFFFLWERQRPWKYTIVVLATAAVLLEYVQNIVNPERKFDALDIVYNLHGVILAVAVCCLFQAICSRRRPVHRSIELEIRPASSAASDEEIDGFVDVRREAFE